MSSIFLRKKMWWMCRWIEGKQVRYSLETHDEKVAKYLKNKADMEEAEGKSILPTKAPPIKNCVNEYIENTSPRKCIKTIKKDKHVLRDFTDWLTVRDMKHITLKIIEEYLNMRIKAEKTAWTVNGDRSIIKKWLNWAVKQSYILSNPASLIRPFPIPQNPPKFLSKQEIHRLLNAAEDTHLYGMIATGLYAGLRVKELMHLEWTDIDFEKNTITVQNKSILGFKTKSKKFRVVPLHPILKKILSERKKFSNFCFVTPEGNRYEFQPKRTFYRIMKNARLVHRGGWHTLRHTFASHLIMSSVDLTTVSKLLGHAHISTTMIYAHLSEQHKKEAVEKLSF